MTDPASVEQPRRVSPDAPRDASAPESLAAVTHAGPARGMAPAILVALVLGFKVWLAAVFPYTGDEAYFTVWGMQPELGYYDHPPMVGWLLALLLRFSDAEWVLRLPAVLEPALAALAVWFALKRVDRDRALLAALALLLVPVHVWNVFITTDTPLALASVLSGLAFWRAIESRSRCWYAAAGVLLGLAFLSKYFAALLGLAYFAYVLLSPRGERDWRGLVITFACAAPFVLLNLWWNYENCWANLMFNLYNRHEGAGFSLKTPPLYALTALYVLSPVALWQLLRSRPRVAAAWRRNGFRFLTLAWAVPFGVFAALSLAKTVGLHWVLSFVPFFFASLVYVLDARQLRRSVIYLAAFSALHVALAGIAAAMPLEKWKSTRFHDGIVFHFRIAQVIDEMRPYLAEFEPAADGYSAAVTASYYAGRYMFVFGTASSHARHDDIVTDFRRLEGRNIMVLRKSAPQPSEYQPYFRSVETRTFAVEGATFHLVLGRGFDYAAYRDRVLAPLRDRYYAIPSYLPQGHCYFCARYFNQSACPVR
jgi:hypothetical protein